MTTVAVRQQQGHTQLHAAMPPSRTRQTVIVLIVQLLLICVAQSM